MKNKKDKKPKVHPDLKDFDIKINSFGELESSHSIEQINDFLNKEVLDKKLKNRSDLDVRREEE